MKIALLGTRGVPACYSGFETCVEQLGQRLVRRGHEVTVSCCSHYVNYEGACYKGQWLVKLLAFSNKYLESTQLQFESLLSTNHENQFCYEGST